VGADERRKYMSKNWSGSITSDEREALKKWYGEKKGAEIKYAESFEICEYGRQPTEEEIMKLFPMLR